jgi:hypothetical protein
MGELCDMNGTEKESMQGFGGKIRNKEPTRKT